MKNILSFTLSLILLLAACAPKTAAPSLPTQAVATPAGPTADLPTEAAPTQLPPTATVASPTDLFTVNDIALPAPASACDGTLTPEQTEGPYYKAGSPARNSLLEPGLDGTRLIVAGYVLDQRCNPLPNAWLDFWQADANGEYDNEGYTLRGHQFTDSQGRYFLETVMPGLYASRPIEHIHVKLLAPHGAPFTTQLYFPGQPIAGLTVQLEERDGFLLAFFNFVLP